MAALARPSPVAVPIAVAALAIAWRILVVNGVLYVSAGGEYAFNALTGQALWTNNTVKSDTSPVVANGLVYFGGNNNNAFALDAKTGAVRWSVQLGGYNNTVSPAMANGVFYIGAYDNNLYAFDGTTGKILWRAVPGAGYAPAVANGVIYTSTDGGLMAFNVKTGRLLWSYLIPYNQQGSVVCSVTIDNGMLYVGTSYGYLDAFHLQGTSS